MTSTTKKMIQWIGSPRAMSSSTVVVVDGGGNGMEPMEPIGVNESCGKDAIATATINHWCS